MKILHISRPDDTASGISAYNLHYKLLDKGHSSNLLVKYDPNASKKKNVYSIYSWRVLLRIRLKEKIEKLFNIEHNKLLADPAYHMHSLSENKTLISTKRIIKRNPQKPDVIIFYFIDRFICSQNIKEIHEYYKVPVFFYLMDMAVLTGGCHFSWECFRFKNNCGCCPALNSNNERDITARILKKKINDYKDIDYQFIIGADWLLEKARVSSIAKGKKITKIMLPVNPHLFKPSDNVQALRDKFEIKKSEIVLLIGATSFNSKRKGMAEVYKALLKFSSLITNEVSERIVLLILGVDGNTQFDNLPFKRKYMGVVSNNDLLPKCYQVSDIFLCPSLQDTGPYMLIEATMCGIPSVSFNMGLAYEFVINGRTGYKANLYDIEDFTKGIIELVELTEREKESYKMNCLDLSRALLLPEIQVNKIEALLEENISNG